MTYHSLGDVFRAASGEEGYGRGYWVTSLRPYGVTESAARGVRDALRRAAQSVFGFPADAGWTASGTIWFRVYDPSSDSANRNDKFIRSVRAAEAAIGGGRLLLPGESPPAGTSPTPTPASVSTSDSSTTPAETSSASTSFDANALQTLLIMRGFSVGSTGADGDFGTGSRRALDAAFGRVGVTPSYTVSSDRRSVTLPTSAWNLIRALPARTTTRTATRSGGSDTLPGATDETTPPPPVEETSAGFLSTPWPWVIGGVVLVGAGAFLLMPPASDKALATNRRRSARRRGRVFSNGIVWAPSPFTEGRLWSRSGYEWDPMSGHLFYRFEKVTRRGDDPVEVTKKIGVFRSAQAAADAAMAHIRRRR